MSQYQLNQIEVLIVDDEEVHAIWAAASLIHSYYSLSREKQFLEPSERSRMAEGHFKIKTVKLPSKVISMIENGYRPDLAIIDINFSELVKDSEISREQIDEQKSIGEISTLGIELAKRIHSSSKETIVVAYTSKLMEEEVLDSLDSTFVLNKSLFVKTKVDGIKNLSKGMPRILKQISQKYFAKLRARDRNYLSNGFLDKTSSVKKILDHEVESESHGVRKRHEIGSLLMHLTRLSVADSGEFQFEFGDKVEITAALEELLKYEEIVDEWHPTGPYGKDYMVRAFEEEMESSKKQTFIEETADKIVLEFSQAIMNRSGNLSAYSFKNRIGQYNTESWENKTNRKKFRAIAINNFIARRVLIAIEAVRQEGSYDGFISGNFADHLPLRVLECLKYHQITEGLTVANFRRIVPQLGLSHKPTGTTGICIQIKPPHIHKHEHKWIVENKQGWHSKILAFR